MIFTPPLTKATLKRRYKRFLAEIITETGEELTIHCPNTGSMMNTFEEGGDIWYLPTDDPNRKTEGTWILSKTPHGRTACVNTHYANTLVEEAINEGIIRELTGYSTIQREVKYGEENSRIDFLLTDPEKGACYVEVKSVTLGFKESQIAAFPDAVTTRGQKHLRELIHLAERGIRAVLLYCVNLTDIKGVRVADEIDPEYAALLKQAEDSGVEIIAYRTLLTPEKLQIRESVDLHL